MKLNKILTPLAVHQPDYAEDLQENLLRPLGYLGFTPFGFNHLRDDIEGYGNIILTFKWDDNLPHDHQLNPPTEEQRIKDLLISIQVQSQPLAIYQQTDGFLFIFITYFD